VTAPVVLAMFERGGSPRVVTVTFDVPPELAAEIRSGHPASRRAVVKAFIGSRIAQLEASLLSSLVARLEDEWGERDTLPAADPESVE
jgi:hypothetical protein